MLHNILLLCPCKSCDVKAIQELYMIESLTLQFRIRGIYIVQVYEWDEEWLIHLLMEIDNRFHYLTISSMKKRNTSNDYIMVPLKHFVHKYVGEDTEIQMCVKPSQ